MLPHKDRAVLPLKDRAVLPHNKPKKPSKIPLMTPKIDKLTTQAVLFTQTWKTYGWNSCTSCCSTRLKAGKSICSKVSIIEPAPLPAACLINAATLCGVCRGGSRTPRGRGAGARVLPRLMINPETEAQDGLLNMLAYVPRPRSALNRCEQSRRSAQPCSPLKEVVVESGILGVAADLDEHLSERLEADRRHGGDARADKPGKRWVGWGWGVRNVSICDGHLAEALFIEQRFQTRVTGTTVLIFTHDPHPMTLMMAFIRYSFSELSGSLKPPKSFSSSTWSAGEEIVCVGRATNSDSIPEWAPQPRAHVIIPRPTCSRAPRSAGVNLSCPLSLSESMRSIASAA